MRKTFEVEALKNKVNGMLKNLPDEDVAARNALQVLVESVLHESGNYSGFQYLDARDMEDSLHGTTVGINQDGNSQIGNYTTAEELYTLRFANTDRTRVKYF